MRHCFLSSVLALVVVVAANTELTVPVAGPFIPPNAQASALLREPFPSGNVVSPNNMACPTKEEVPRSCALCEQTCRHPRPNADCSPPPGCETYQCQCRYGLYRDDVGCITGRKCLERGDWGGDPRFPDGPWTGLDGPDDHLPVGWDSGTSTKKAGDGSNPTAPTPNEPTTMSKPSLTTESGGPPSSGPSLPTESTMHGSDRPTSPNPPSSEPTHPTDHHSSTKYGTPTTMFHAKKCPTKETKPSDADIDCSVDCGPDAYWDNCPTQLDCDCSCYEERPKLQSTTLRRSGTLNEQNEGEKCHTKPRCMCEWNYVRSVRGDMNSTCMPIEQCMVTTTFQPPPSSTPTSEHPSASSSNPSSTSVPKSSSVRSSTSDRPHTETESHKPTTSMHPPTETTSSPSSSSASKSPPTPCSVPSSTPGPSPSSTFDPSSTSDRPPTKTTSDGHSCGPNADWTPCPLNKDGSCDDIREDDEGQQKRRKRAGLCLKAGCRCRQGFVRQTKGYDNHCVKIEECLPPKTTTGNPAPPKDNTTHNPPTSTHPSIETTSSTSSSTASKSPPPPPPLSTTETPTETTPPPSPTSSTKSPPPPPFPTSDSSSTSAHPPTDTISHSTTSHDPHPPCGPNADWVPCPQSRDGSCDDIREDEEGPQKRRKRAGHCLKEGCRCRPGYVRQTKGYDNHCVKFEDCLPPKNSTAKTAYPKNSTEPTTSMRPPTETTPSPSSSSSSVSTPTPPPPPTTKPPTSTTSCPGQCGCNARYVDCPQSKDASCDDAPDSDEPLLRRKRACLKPGCRCDPGYVRQTAGYDDACVKIESCKAPPPTTTSTTRKSTSNSTTKTTPITPRTTFETTHEPRTTETTSSPSTSESPTSTFKPPTTTTPHSTTPRATTHKPPTDKDCQERYGQHSHLVPCPMPKTCEQPDGPEIHGHVSATGAGKAYECTWTGCKCDAGFVMSDNGRDAICILLEDCSPIAHTTTPKSPQCGPNEGYAVCPRRKDLTCDTRLHPGDVSPPSTTCMQPGCRCTPGHVRLSDDPHSGCVAVCECPNYDPFAELECGQNEEFVKCPKYEDATCKEVPEPRRSRRASPFGEDCLKPRCMCKAGYVRENRERDAACVSRRACLQKRHPDDSDAFALKNIRGGDGRD